MTDWFALVGAVGGIAGAGVGIPSAVAARRSMKAAEQSAAEAKRAAQIESSNQHDEFRPVPPPRIDTDLRNDTLFGSITVPRDYRVTATGVSYTEAKHQIEIPLLIRANRSQEFAIESWPEDRKTPKTREIRFRFWPPIDQDDASQWTCHCDRPDGNNTDADGHWEWTVQVSEPPSGPLVAFR